MRRVAVALLLGLVFPTGCDRRASSRHRAEALTAAALAPSMSGTGDTANDSTPIIVRRLWSGPEVDFSGDVSSDGRYLTYVDWSTGDLALRALSTGDVRRLTDKGPWTESEEFADASVVSPGGQRVTYAWWDGMWNYELRIVGVDGSEPRILYRGDSLGHVEPHDWSSDGGHILASVLKAQTIELVLVSATDGSLRVLKSFARSYPVKAGFSPDGRFVVYDREVQQGSRDRDIFVLSTDEGREVRLVENPAVDFVLGWAPDGGHILFSSDRTGTPSAWIVPVANGEAASPPTLIKPDVWGLNPIGFARNGAYYYGVDLSTTEVQVAALNLETGEVLTSPTPVTERRTSSRGTAEWSPDGRYLAYSRPGSRPRRSASHPSVSIRSVANGETRDITLDLRSIDARLLRWSPDGHHLLLPAHDHERRNGLFQVDVQTDEVELLVDLGPDRSSWWAEWSPDAKTLYYRVNESEDSRIVARDIETSTETVLQHRTPPQVLSWWVDTSPDGQHLAFFEFEVHDGQGFSTRLIVAPIAGGPSREVYRLGSGDGIPHSLVWSPDGQKLVYMLSGSKEAPAATSVWVVSAQGGTPERLDLTMEGTLSFSLHPDGRRIAFTSGQSGAEIWVMEDFLPSGEIEN